MPGAALALVRAGFFSLTDLEGVTRAELLAIPGVGPGTLEVVEHLLGRPLPGKRAKIPHRPPWPDMIWRQRGISPEAAVTFAQVGMTLERLRSITREELLALFRVGPATVRACDLLIGQAIPASRPSDPVAASWRSRGIPAKAAKALSQAGIGSAEDLARWSREDLLALPRVSANVLRRLQKILGSDIPSKTEDWRRRGLSLYIAHALLRAGIHTLEDLQALSRDRFLALPGLGAYALGRCEKLLGHQLPSR